MTSHNKGKHYWNCPECKRRRYCFSVSIPNHNYRYTCSKGHSWIVKGVTVARISAMMDEIFNKTSLENLFNRDNMFFKNLRSK